MEMWGAEFRFAARSSVTRDKKPVTAPLRRRNGTPARSARLMPPARSLAPGRSRSSQHRDGLSGPAVWRVAAHLRARGVVSLLSARAARPATPDAAEGQRPKGSVMTRTKRCAAALIALGLAAAPFAASAQISAAGTQNSMSGSSGAPATQGATYGSSGQTVGTVTAPSIGTYNRPSVGVTNSVPTWNNTNPPGK